MTARFTSCRQFASKLAAAQISLPMELLVGTGLTAQDINHCRWLRPQLVASIEFLEWVEKC
jgi:hypothetical protein